MQLAKFCFLAGFYKHLHIHTSAPDNLEFKSFHLLKAAINISGFWCRQWWVLKDFRSRLIFPHVALLQLKVNCPWFKSWTQPFAACLTLYSPHFSSLFCFLSLETTPYCSAVNLFLPSPNHTFQPDHTSSGFTTRQICLCQNVWCVSG